MKKQKEADKIDFKKMATEFSKNYARLCKWLYDNHRHVLREYEKSTSITSRMEFA